MNGATFLDSAALFAAFDSRDASHERAAHAWSELLRSDGSLHTTNYVVLELSAVLQRRLGIDAVEALSAFVLPWVQMLWVDQPLHALGVAGLLAARRRDLSLVDTVSFAAMRSLGIRKAFTLDSHFAEQGFEVLPASPN